MPLLSDESLRADFEGTRVVEEIEANRVGVVSSSWL